MARTKSPAPPQNSEEEAHRALVEAHEAHGRAIEEAHQIELQQDEANPLGTPSILTEPPVPPDNPKNPRGVASNLCDGQPDAQATGAQKTQNPTPARPPTVANVDPPISILERVSAGQNRKPPSETIP